MCTRGSGSAWPPPADIAGAHRRRLLMPQPGLSTRPGRNDRNRPRAVVYRYVAQCPLTDCEPVVRIARFLPPLLTDALIADDHLTGAGHPRASRLDLHDHAVRSGLIGHVASLGQHVLAHMTQDHALTSIAGRCPSSVVRSRRSGTCFSHRETCDTARVKFDIGAQAPML